MRIKLEHIGIAVADADATAEMLGELLGVGVYKKEFVAPESVQTSFLDAGNTKIEIVSPLSEDSALGRSIKARGEGLHHLAFEVDNITSASQRLRSLGFRVLSDTPYEGADGKSVFFVHPSDTNRVLFEFCQSTRPAGRIVRLEGFEASDDVVETGNRDATTILVFGGDPTAESMRLMEPRNRLVFIPDSLTFSNELVDALVPDDKPFCAVLVTCIGGHTTRDILSTSKLPESLAIVSDTAGLPDLEDIEVETLVIARSSNLTPAESTRLTSDARRSNIDVGLIPSSCDEAAAGQIIGKSLTSFFELKAAVRS